MAHMLEGDGNRWEKDSASDVLVDLGGGNEADGEDSVESRPWLSEGQVRKVERGESQIWRG